MGAVAQKFNREKREKNEREHVRMAKKHRFRIGVGKSAPPPPAHCPRPPLPAPFTHLRFILATDFLPWGIAFTTACGLTSVAVAERPAKPPKVYPRTSALKEVHIETVYEWSLEDSVFASYNMDTSALLHKCFSEDFAMGKVRVPPCAFAPTRTCGLGGLTRGAVGVRSTRP